MSEQRALQAPTVLANRGVPVQVFEVKGKTLQDGVTVVYESDYDSVTTKWVKLTALAVAQIEEHYGSLEKWQQASEIQPSKVVVDTLAFIWHETKGAVSARLLEGQIADYLLALQIAAYRSQGVAVDDLGKLLKRGMEDVTAQTDLVSTTLLELLKTDDPDQADDQPTQPEPSSSDSEPEN